MGLPGEENLELALVERDVRSQKESECPGPHTVPPGVGSDLSRHHFTFSSASFNLDRLLLFGYLFGNKNFYCIFGKRPQGHLLGKLHTVLGIGLKTRYHQRTEDTRKFQVLFESWSGVTAERSQFDLKKSSGLATH